MRNALRTTASALAILLALGCGSGEETSTGEPAAETSGSAMTEAAEATPSEPSNEPPTAEGSAMGAGEETAAAEPAEPQASDGETYQINAIPVEGGYAAGALGTFSVHIEGAGGWHMNEDYPVRITLSGPDHVEFPSPTIGRDAAAAFSEEEARFDVPFMPNAAGRHHVEAEIRFAVCSPESCLTKTDRVGLLLAVNEGAEAEAEAAPEATN